MSDLFAGLFFGSMITITALAALHGHQETKENQACIIEHKELCKTATVPISLLEGVKHEYD